MRFGIDVAQHQLSWDELLSRVRYAEDVGFDGAWVFDHFTALYADPKGPCLEGWTLLAALAASTSRIRLGALVTGMTHRHPSVLATEAVTVDHVSGGRLELAVGAAWNEEEHRELGIPFPPVGERIDRLEEGVRLMRLLMTEDDVTFEGRHYHLENATFHPRPAQQPHPPIWIGAHKPRGLGVVGRRADVWHSWGPADAYRRKWARVERAAEAAGRDPASIARASSLSISEPWDEVRRTFDGLADAGVSYLVVEWPSEGKGRLEEFIQNVMPTLAG